jgi:hypothetical protein
MAVGVHARSFSPQVRELPRINWRRGRFRIWLLLSAAWIMAWTIDLILWTLRFGMETGDVAAVPVLLFGPPMALLVFGTGVRWAFRGFNLDRDSTDA